MADSIPSMKTNSIPALLLLAAIAAAIVFPLSIECSVTLVMFAGFAAVGSEDYLRPAKAPAPGAEVSAFPIPSQKAGVRAAA